MKELRPYQRDTIARVYAEMRAGRTRVVAVMPTGSGKTVTGAEVVRQGIARGRQVLWLAHRTELIDQTCATLAEEGLDVGAISARSAWPVRASAPVQVASVQTLVARESIRPPAHLLVWDECHHAGEAAAEWIKVLDAYPGTPMLGLTATPERGDGTGLAPIFSGIVQGVTTRQLTQSGHLVACEIDRPSTWLKAKRGAGNPLAQDPVDRYLEIARGRPAFLFAASVEEAGEYSQRLTDRGTPAVVVSAQTPPDARAAAVALFRAGRMRVLCNVFVFTEGTDLPSAEVCILARGASTAGAYLQMVGRVLRPSPGKRSALLIDLQGVSHVFGCPEDERHWRLTGKACIVSGRKCDVCKVAIEDYPCPSCGYMPEPDARDTGATEIVNEPMARFARKIAEGPQQRRETAVRWVRAALLKGHRPSSVRFKWRAVYQEDMPREMYEYALREAGAA